MESPIQTDSPTPLAKAPPKLPNIHDRRSFYSEPFEITAKSGKRFFIHSDVLTAQSKAPRITAAAALAEKKLNLSESDDDIVERFIEFLYFGDYQILGPISQRDEVAKTKKEEVEVAVVEEEQKITVEEGGRANLDSSVLVVHAKVYTLAAYNGTEALQKLALERLMVSLDRIGKCMLESPLDPSAYSGITPLLEYIGSKPCLKGSVKPMRDLVLSSVADIWLLTGWQKTETLFEACGDLGPGMLDKVAERLRDSGKKLNSMEIEVRNWKDRAIESEERLRKLEADSAKTQKLEDRIAELERCL